MSERVLIRVSPLRCCQCGRVGHNGFGIIPEAVHEPTHQLVGPFVVCANENGTSTGCMPDLGQLGVPKAPELLRIARESLEYVLDHHTDGNECVCDAARSVAAAGLRLSE